MTPPEGLPPKGTKLRLTKTNFWKCGWGKGSLITVDGAYDGEGYFRGRKERGFLSKGPAYHNFGRNWKEGFEVASLPLPEEDAIRTKQMGEVAIASDGTHTCIGTTAEHAKRGVEDMREANKVREEDAKTEGDLTIKEIADGRERLRIAELSGESKADYQSAMRRYSDKWRAEVAKTRRLETSLSAARAEAERLKNTDQRVPGMWGCRTCGFVQMRSILYAGNGAIGANTETLMESCPNDGDVMFPYTYKQLAKENQDIGEAAVIRARNLEEELATLREENRRLREWQPIRGGKDE